MLTPLSRSRPLAPPHQDPTAVPSPPADHHLQHPDRAPQHRAQQRGDLPGPAERRVDAGVQRPGERAGCAHAAELPGGGQPAKRRRGGSAEGRGCDWYEEAG